MAAGKEIRGQDQELREHQEDHQGHGNGLGGEDAQGAGAHARARPYAEKVRSLAANLAAATPEYKHPFMVKNESAKTAGFILVTTDKGLCGGLNTNVLRAVTASSRRPRHRARRFRPWPSATKAWVF